jgi:hypothetical protein
MSATELRRGFRRRFRAVARQIWSLHVGRGVARTVLVAAVLVAVVATADYFLELPRLARAGLLALVATIVALLAAVWVVRPALAWNRPRVAAELEGLFPRLGQRVRTATQHGERSAEELKREGVAPGLVAALEEETAEKAKPLPFQAALPVRPAVFAAALAAVAVVAVVAVAVWVPEWRIAVQRAALAPTPYTTLTATASAETVDEGTDVGIRATMAGRARPAVVLNVREAGEAEWRQETMDPTEDGFTARLVKLRVTTEFFVSAGPERTPVQQIVVRHALKIAEARAEVTSPAYTGVPLAKYDTGSFSAIQGSTAKMWFTLDRAPASAALVVKETGKAPVPPRRIPMTVQDRTISAELALAVDVEYSIEARDANGMPLVANRNRVRVVADQPPSVWFESPGEALEVHTLAEVLVRVRARDDFGLTKLGIVFQINNEEERTLVLVDVTDPHQQEAKAEQLLQLEQFLLTQKDCVAYYAFAEDGRPDAPQRTTTELRFIDIRPFQRTYRVMEANEGMPGQQRELASLDEVIARQRFNLNQTIRLESRSKVRLDLAQVEKVAAFENKLASQTHDLADFLATLGVDGAAILAQAEEAMLSAVDSLNGAKFTTAINQERDALRYLMEARDTVQQTLQKQPRAIRAQVRAFDRIQRQKLRRPNDQTETLQQIADELAKLANDEDEVARMIAGPGPGGDPMAKPMPDGVGPKPEPKKGKVEDPAFEKQEEIAGRAGALEKTSAGAKGLTPLAKMRIAEAVKAANAGADALGQGNRPGARPEVDRAKELFREAAKQVAALAALEAAQQLAMARDMANEIAARVAPNDMKTPGAGGSGDGKMPGVGGVAEKAKTVKDVLENLAGSTVAADADAARKAAGILKQEDLGAAIGRLEKLEKSEKTDKPGAGGDRAEQQDLADRFAALGQKLDQAYREAVAPRLEEIAKLERQANDLEQRAAAADDAADWRRVRQQAEEFAERLEGAGLDPIAENLRASLKGAGVNGPAGYEALRRGLALTHAQLVAKLQEFVAVDRFTTGNEAVPPEYKDLVERYLRTLSAGGSK